MAKEQCVPSLSDRQHLCEAIWADPFMPVRYDAAQLDWTRRSNRWRANVLRSKVEPMKEIAEMIRNHFEGVPG